MKLTRNSICVICLLLLIVILSAHPIKENFTKKLSYQTIPHEDDDRYSSWIYKANNYTEEMKYQDKLDAPSQQILKNDLKNSKKMFLLNNYFKPQCCPSVYSNEQGCACLTHEQIMHLSKRAGNATNTY
jgi:hypothetical protein